MIRRPPIVLALAMAVAALGPPVAVGAVGPWSDPVDVWTDPALTATNPGVGYDTSGRGLFSWALTGNPANRAFLTALRSVAPDGTLEQQRFSTDTVLGRPAFYAAQRVAVLKRRSRAGASKELSVQFASTRDAALGVTRKIDKVGPGDAAIAGNRLGLIAVLYSEPRSGSDVLWLALRRPKHSFQAPVTIRRGPSFGRLAVSVGDGGKIVVAYQRGSRIEVRVRRPAAAIDPPEDIGSAAGLQSVQAAVSQNGNAVVAWQRAQGLGQSQEVVTVRAAMLFAGTRLFRRADVLATPRGGPGSDAPIHAVIDAHGRATEAWSAADAGVFTDRTTLAGAWRPPVQASAAGVLGDLALDEDGATLAVWRRSGAIEASFISRFGEVGSPELVAQDAAAGAPVAAFDPRRAAPTVAWLHADPSGTGASLRASTGAGLDGG
ncbi:MAG: hypothetical protein QOG15_2459 [Solirubrobacteraceae bacterium]|jgi:hypothetical protein|nr:hypothetical protein [Solirubrobacteraceae bacterium]